MAITRSLSSSEVEQIPPCAKRNRKKEPIKLVASPPSGFLESSKSEASTSSSLCYSKTLPEDFTAMKKVLQELIWQKVAPFHQDLVQRVTTIESSFHQSNPEPRSSSEDSSLGHQKDQIWIGRQIQSVKRGSLINRLLVEAYDLEE
uniref:Uncharacterized protein n=1 Tax=Anthurium amnicola TaxID=1678845 RepID=A0A1D1YVB5_9ARAE